VCPDLAACVCATILGVVLFGYLLRAVLVRAGIALPALSLVYLGFHLSDGGRALVDRVGWGGAMAVGLLHLPMIAVQVAPVALLLGIVTALGALRQRGELEALATMGASPWRIRRPLMLGGAIFALLAFALDELVVPSCEQAVDRRHSGPMVSSLTGLTAPVAWLRRGDWFVQLDQERTLAVQTDNTSRIVRRVEGESGVDGTLRHATQWMLGAGVPVREDRTSLHIPALAGIERLRHRTGVRAEAMDVVDLVRHLAELRRAGQARTAEDLVLHTKVAFPLVNVLMALFGCLFVGRASRRTGAMAGDLGRAAAVILGVWLTLAMGWSLARTGWISPAVGVWGPVLGGAVMAGILWQRRPAC